MWRWRAACSGAGAFRSGGERHVALAALKGQWRDQGWGFGRVYRCGGRNGVASKQAKARRLLGGFLQMWVAPWQTGEEGVPTLVTSSRQWDFVGAEPAGLAGSALCYKSSPGIRVKMHPLTVTVRC